MTSMDALKQYTLQVQQSAGTAMKSRYNPTAFLWVMLLGIPGTLLFLILAKMAG